jgi:hypothetical protein
MTNKFKCRATVIFGLAATLSGFRPAALAQVGSAHQGADAIQTLKDQGVYQSLQNAVRAARYQIRQDNISAQRMTAPYSASNPEQKYGAEFAPAGLSLKSAETTWRGTMQFFGYGYGENIAVAGTPELVAQGNRIEYQRPSEVVTEWYVNTEAGLEQGFTIASPPGFREEGSQLRLLLKVTGGWRATPSTGTHAIALTFSNGEPPLSYGNLHAHDAQGRELRSRMSATEEEVTLEVDDGQAVYPVTVDPVFTQQARLVGNDGAIPGADHFGYSVAVFSNTAVVGAPDDDGTAGAAYVFVRSGTIWTQQQKLTNPYPSAHDAFGRSVAIWGNTIVVGAPSEHMNGGALGLAFVFTRSGFTWNLKEELAASGGANGDLFGYSVAIDAYTGGTILIGAPQDNVGGNAGQGSVWVFVRNNNAFLIQQKLTAAGGGAGDNFGWSVAVEAYTSGRAVVGAPHGGSINQGVVYTFQRNNASWIQEIALAPADGARGDEFGHVVAINVTGNRMVVGAPFDDIGANMDQGSVYLYEVGAP